jgi:integrase
LHALADALDRDGAEPHEHGPLRCPILARARGGQPHDLRHRYASMKIAEGVPVTTVAAQLGHSKKSLTLDTYAHVLLENEA